MMKKIRLANGEYAVVDDEDFYALSKFKWHVRSLCGSVVRQKCGNGIKIGDVFMRREILGLPFAPKCRGKAGVKHLNDDKLDLRKSNLVLLSHKESQRGRHKNKGVYSSIYKGVSKHRNNTFIAHIKYDGKKRHLGVFCSEEEAAVAYDKAAKKHFGVFARLNIIDGGTDE